MDLKNVLTQERRRCENRIREIDVAIQGVERVAQDVVRAQQTDYLIQSQTWFSE